ncbi:TetR/AcrR family transcriptional regulator [Vitiosangium sp. GDMCC 1.1324]|uniref:TetR/AcrR family transcriptional regulator n=1 Tax=Vitiosangium sp. (strain GDMCC 1.1324) TaxID=2138576 RepID=UPI000D33F9C6|nr:TetR/AcrR family transcriptional regulator [Vitiosangium sp. GDMCC 1.1324]PTL77576.1 hypothetical protein DAT35_43000 [Vitiosangium sp. GDMCC 1.1324]
MTTRANESETRQDDLGLAVLRLIATHGMDAVSYGAVAAEAGVSKGLVQHFFPSRNALVQHAIRLLARRVGRRVEAALRQAPSSAKSPSLVHTLLALLPTDDDARLDATAGRALFAHALVDHSVNETYRQGRRASFTLVRTLLAEFRPQGSDRWLDETTRDLLGTLEQVGDDLLLGELKVPQAQALIRQRVESL